MLGTRWLGLAALCASSVASAQPDVAASAEPGSTAKPPSIQPIGYGAEPGGIHVPMAMTLPAGVVEVGLLGGFGYRKGLLSEDSSFKRGIGDVAAAYGVTDTFTLGLSLDGRADSHSPKDSGYVGDPHLLARFGKELSPRGAILGGQLNLWIPGKDAPSVAGSAISVDVRALASIPAGPGYLSIGAGFRLDNSDKSVDHPEMLSAADRVSLGVSTFNAVLGGISYTVATDKMWFGAEASTDYFIGSNAPGGIFRAGASLGFRLSEQFAALIFVEGAKVPGLSYGEVAMGNVTLIPYEPVVTGGLGLQARFGGARSAAGSITKNENPTDVAVIVYAEVAGEVSDDKGKPVVGARVSVKLKNNTGTAVTDETGTWKVEKLPIGKTVGGKTELDDVGAEITVEVDTKKPAKTTLTLAKGPNAVAKTTLESVLPPGELRAIVKSLISSKPLAGATVKIEPGGKTATTDAEGKFAIELPPGTYKITVDAPGHAQQQLDVTIEQNGVAIKNIDLHK